MFDEINKRYDIDKMKDKSFLLKLIASEDRHDLSNFLYDVDNAKRRGLLEDSDFILFRNGFVVNAVIELRDAKNVIGRDLQPSELLDKINYLSLVPDFESLNVAYTNDTIIDGLCNNDRDFSWWFTCGTMNSLPVEVRNNIAIKLLDKGDVQKAMYVLESIKRTLKNEREYSDNKGFSR